MFAKITPNPAASRRYFAGPRKPADDNRAGAMPVRRSVRARLLCRWHRAENGRLGCYWELEQSDASSGNSPPRVSVLAFIFGPAAAVLDVGQRGWLPEKTRRVHAVRAMARGFDQELEK
jgi:hypothetical protein